MNTTAEQAQPQNSDGYRDKLVDVQRVAKVVSGGRTFGFAALMVVGDGEGKIGWGRGKAREVPVAIQKASENARRNMVQIDLKDGTLFHPIRSRYGSTTVIMNPAAKGTGIIAGGPMRAVLEVLGVENVLAKIMGSTNPSNVVKATIQGLLQMVTPNQIAEKRGKSIKEIFGEQGD